MGKDGNFQIKKSVAEKYRVAQIEFQHFFAGPLPVFEITKRVQNAKPVPEKKPKKAESGGDKNKKSKGQGTLDSWVKGEGGKKKPGPQPGQQKSENKVKKQTPAEVEAEMKRIREQNERFRWVPAKLWKFLFDSCGSSLSLVHGFLFLPFIQKI